MFALSLNQVLYFSTGENRMTGPALKDFGKAVAERYLPPQLSIRIALKSLTFVLVGPVITRSPNFWKKV